MTPEIPTPLLEKSVPGIWTWNQLTEYTAVRHKQQLPDSPDNSLDLLPETLLLPELEAARHVFRLLMNGSVNERSGFLHQDGSVSGIREGEPFSAHRSTAEFLASGAITIMHSHPPGTSGWKHTVLKDLGFLASQNLFRITPVVEDTGVIMLLQPDDYRVPGDMPGDFREFVSLQYDIAGRKLLKAGIPFGRAESIAMKLVAELQSVAVYTGKSFLKLNRRILTPSEWQLLDKVVFSLPESGKMNSGPA